MSASGLAQSADTSAGEKEEIQKQELVQEQKKGPEKIGESGKSDSVGQKLEGFVDIDGNGIDDRLEQRSRGKGKQKGKGLRRDRFVDTDGDGIYDGRESAIGLRKLYRKRKGNPGNR